MADVSIFALKEKQKKALKTFLQFITLLLTSIGKSEVKQNIFAGVSHEINLKNFGNIASGVAG